MDDLISRQAAIDAVDKYDFNFPQYMERFVTELRDAMKGDIKDDIKVLPSAQPERKKGRWIPVDDPSITGRCSICGFESHLCEDDVYGYDYCPNCGTRLEVVDE